MISRVFCRLWKLHLPATVVILLQINLAYRSNGSCVDYINDVSKDYNEHLLPEILSLNEKIPNATIMYINIYTSILNAAQHPTQFGKVKSS